MNTVRPFPIRSLAPALTVAASLLLAGAATTCVVASSLPAAPQISPPASPPAAPPTARAGASALPSQEIVLRNGLTWRGEIGDRVRIDFTENAVPQTLEGTLKSIEKTYLVLATTLAGRPADKTIFRFDITKMESIDGAAATPADPKRSETAPRTPGTTPQRTTPSGMPTTVGEATEGTTAKRGVFVLPLQGTVGIGLRNEEMDKMAAHADKFGPGQIIVFHIDSPGGLVVEGDLIHESLVEIKKRHRLVAWIKEAISGAAFTALHCDEIYFMRVGTLGAITMHAGGRAVPQSQVVAWVERCAQIAEIGGRSPIPVRAMVANNHMASYDKDPVTGKVTWYPNTQGQFVLSTEKENLVFNASNALHSGFSDGTADTTAELAVLLQLPEWHEIDDYGRRIAKDWQDTVEACGREVPKIIARLDFKNLSSGAEAALGTRVSLLRELQGWWDRCENVMQYQVGVPPKEDLERMIRDLQKQIADMRKARRTN